MRALVVAIVAGWVSVGAAAPLTGDVQVWQDATFYLAPSDQAASFTLVSLDEPRDRATEWTVQMHLIAQHGDFFELAPLGAREDAAKCSWGELDIDARLEGLHLYVHGADLAPALVARWHHAFRDGTRIALSPGVPVGPPVPGGRTIAINSHGEGPARLVLAIPDADVGVTFTPSPGHAPARRPWEIVLPSEGATRVVPVLGGHPVTLGHTLPLVAPLTYRGDRALVSSSVGCAQLVVSMARARAHVYRSPDGPGADVLGAGSAPAELTMLVPRGTPLATRAGRPVATAAVDFAVAPATAGQACTELTLTLERDQAPPADGKLVLCAPAHALVPRPVHSLSSAPG